MVLKYKFLSVIGFFIISCSLFNSGCKQEESLPEVNEEVVEETSEECNNVEKPDTLSEPVPEATTPKPLTLIITNLDPAKSPVNLVFYQQKHDFLSKTDILRGYQFMSNGDTLTIQIKDISYSELAIAFYQDVNQNAECDRNFLGIPKEPYSFSNNFKPRLKAPRFDDCKFIYNEKEHTLRLSML